MVNTVDPRLPVQNPPQVTPNLKYRYYEHEELKSLTALVKNVMKSIANIFILFGNYTFFAVEYLKGYKPKITPQITEQTATVESSIVQRALSNPEPATIAEEETEVEKPSAAIMAEKESSPPASPTVSEPELPQEEQKRSEEVEEEVDEFFDALDTVTPFEIEDLEEKSEEGFESSSLQHESLCETLLQPTNEVDFTKIFTLEETAMLFHMFVSTKLEEFIEESGETDKTNEEKIAIAKQFCSEEKMIELKFEFEQQLKTTSEEDLAKIKDQLSKLLDSIEQEESSKKKVAS